jgi:hypothetical protein
MAAEMNRALLPTQGAPHLKPAIGAKCNRCGLCCMSGLCELGQVVFERKDGACPALERNDGTPGYRGGLMARPARYVPALATRHGASRLAAAARVLLGPGLHVMRDTPTKPGRRAIPSGSRGGGACSRGKSGLPPKSGIFGRGRRTNSRAIEAGLLCPEDLKTAG